MSTWSVSQNKFIDAPQQGGVAPSAGGSGSQYDLSKMLDLAVSKTGSTEGGRVFDMYDELSQLKEEEDAKAKKEKTFRALEDLYFGGGVPQGGWGGIDNAIGAAKIPVLGQLAPNQPASVYRGQLDSMLSGFAKAGSDFGGDSGNIGYIEQLLQRAAFPGARSTVPIAMQKFAEQRGKLGLQPRADYNLDGLPGQKRTEYGSSLELD
jgi:hypothetical protein